MPEIHLGTVTNVLSDGVYVEVPALGVGMEFGPCEVVTDTSLMAVGVKVAVASIDGIAEDLVVLGVLGSDSGGSGGSDSAVAGYINDTTPSATRSALNSIYASLAAVAGKEPIIAAGTVSQYWRGDKTWQTLDKAAVGLGNVDNTSDLNKPVSTAQQTALDGKQPLNADLTAIAALTPTNDDLVQRKAGAWTNRTPAQVKVDLALVKGDVGLGNVDNTSDATKNSAAATLTNKTLALGSNTVSGTRAQFNTAMTDDDFASLTGTETLTNKTLTSPKIGTALYDTNGNVLLRVSPTASAVNDLQLANAATGSAPSLTADGTDADISINLVPKGLGVVQANGNEVIAPIPVRLATRGAITLSGAQTIDGVAVATGDLVLVRSQGVYSGNSYDNGIWQANTAGAWARPTAFNSSAKLAGKRFIVTEGTIFRNAIFTCGFKSTDTLGTTSMSFSETRIELGSTFEQPQITSNDVGHAWFNTTDRRLLVWNGAVWQTANGVMDYDGTGPSFPVAGEPWYDSTNDLLKVYSGSAWKAVAGGGDTAGVVSATGAWSTAAPANGTTGTTFSITRPGTYLLTAELTGYVAAAGVAATEYFYIDGTLGGSRTFFFNPASQHMALPRVSWTQTLTAGTHYWFCRFSHSSDTNDNASLTWQRV